MAGHPLFKKIRLYALPAVVAVLVALIVIVPQETLDDYAVIVLPVACGLIVWSYLGWENRKGANRP